MSVQSVTGAVGWYPQAGKGFHTAVGQAFYWHPALRASLAPVQLQRTFDRELGTTLLPMGAYKGGVYCLGQVDVLPRIDDAIAMLMFGYCGSVTSTGAGPYTHIFGGEDSSIPTKYMAFRKRVPKADGNFMGETYWDGRPMGITLTAQAGNILAMSCNIQAIVPELTDPASGTGWTPLSDQGGYEDYQRVPIASRALVTMPDGTLSTDFRNLQISTVLNAPKPEDEMVIGSYYPHDITPLSRDVTITGQAFWRNSTLYRALYYGGGSNTDWAPAPYSGQFGCEFETAADVMQASSMTGILGFLAPKCIWACQPIDLVGGDIVVMNMTGTVVNNVAWEDWRMYMRNDTAQYTWPS